MKHENKFQAELIKELKKIFPGCFVFKNDSGYIQGIPDLTILYKNKWAILECKKSAHEPHQPNQDRYIDILSRMSYSSFVYPENKNSVLEQLKELFE